MPGTPPRDEPPGTRTPAADSRFQFTTPNPKDGEGCGIDGRSGGSREVSLSIFNLIGCTSQRKSTFQGHRGRRARPGLESAIANRSVTTHRRADCQRPDCQATAGGSSHEPAPAYRRPLQFPAGGGFVGSPAAPSGQPSAIAIWLRSRAPRAAGMSLNRCAITCLIISRLASLAPFFSPPRPSSEPPTAPRAVILFRPGIVRPSPARPPIPPSRLPPPASSRGPPPSVPSVFSVAVPCRQFRPRSLLPIRSLSPAFRALRVLIRVLPESASFAHS